MDLQDTKLEESFKYIKDYIKSADENPIKSESLKHFRKVWAGLDDCIGLAEARTGLSVVRLELPKLAEEPKWFKNAESDLREEYPNIEKYSLIRCLDDAKKLICGCINDERYSKLDAEVYSAIGNSICVDWNIENGKHQWLVRLSDLPWPGCLVYVLNRKGLGDEAERETLILHDAFSVIDYFREKVGESI